LSWSHRVSVIRSGPADALGDFCPAGARHVRRSAISAAVFTTAVKIDSNGRIITGPTSDPTKTLVGAEFAGDRAGVARYTKILFGADYFSTAVGNAAVGRLRSGERRH
jgi:hypothetical protein